VESAIRSKKETEYFYITLKYYKVSQTQKAPAIKKLKKISRLGQRIYVKAKDIKKVKNDFGIAIISTSKGIMTGGKAHKMGLGGEYICEIW
jgi:small subunit ribosomal protein S8